MWLGIIPKDPVLIEGQAPVGREIRGEPGARRDSVVQRGHASVFAVLLGHRAGKFLAQRFDPPEERQINIGNCVADEKPAAVALQDLLEVTQKLWQPLGCEILGAPLGFALLIFVIQTACDRMRAEEIGDRSFNLNNLSWVL